MTDGRGRAVRDGGLGRWLEAAAPRSARGAVAIALVSDARMRTFNRRYRRKDSTTDVLSFPAEVADAPARAPRLLGDLVIATGVAARQAREAGHGLQTELRVLALHGLLHLLGYDHDDPADQGRMARAESRLRRQGGLKTGLIQRAAASASAKKRLRPVPSGRRAAPQRGAREGARAGVGPREPEEAPAARPSGRRAAPQRGAREGARAGVGPREP